MHLIKAKQLDILSVASELTTKFNDNANVSLRNSFVDSIKNAPGFDEKVKADSTDDTPNYLSQKLIGSSDNDTSAVKILTNYDSTVKKVRVSGTIDVDTIASTVATKFIPIFFEAEQEITTYTNSDLENKTVLYVVREHSFLYPGVNGDDYLYDSTTGTITFNSPVGIGERISLLII